MNIGGWLATHRTQALLGAGGAVAGFALYRSKKAAHGAGPGGGGMFGTSASAAVPSISGSYGPYDSSQIDQYNQLAGAISSANDQINTLGTQLAAVTAGLTSQPASTGLSNPASAIGPNGLPDQHIMGGGYIPVNAADAANPFGGYQWISNPSVAQQDASQGVQLFYEPTIGNFQPISGNNFGALLPNTPVYAKT